jgi:hypothetical protein
LKAYGGSIAVEHLPIDPEIKILINSLLGTGGLCYKTHYGSKCYHFEIS